MALIRISELWTYRACSKCHEVLHTDFFAKNIKTKSGFAYHCKSCKRLYGQYQDKKQPYRRSPKGRYIYSKHAAKTRNIEFSLTRQEYISVVGSASCFYCQGSLPVTGSGLDRVDSSVGYTKNNVVPCCGRCNWTKGDRWTFAQFCEFIPILRKLKKEELSGAGI